MTYTEQTPKNPRRERDRGMEGGREGGNALFSMTPQPTIRQRENKTEGGREGKKALLSMTPPSDSEENKQTHKAIRVSERKE
jgi:hypothetical protein